MEQSFIIQHRSAKYALVKMVVACFVFLIGDHFTLMRIGWGPVQLFSVFLSCGDGGDKPSG